MEKKECKMTSGEMLELSGRIKNYIYEKGYGEQQVLEFLSADLIVNLGSRGVSKEKFKKFCDMLCDEFNDSHDKIVDILTKSK